jgi:hypothetical protein
MQSRLLAHFMRLFLLKAAHANMVGAAYGKSGWCVYGYETEVL